MELTQIVEKTKLIKKNDVRVYDSVISHERTWSSLLLLIITGLYRIQQQPSCQ